MEEQLARFADQLMELVSTYGPDVADTVLQVARVTAIKELLVGFMALVVFAVFLYLTLKFHRRMLDEYKRNASGGDQWVFPLIGCAFVAFCSALPVAGYLLDLWNWVGVFEPK